MRTVVLPNGKEVVQQRLPKEGYMRLRTTKVLNRKKNNNRQDEKKVIQEQLALLEEYKQDLEEEIRFNMEHGI